MKFRTLGCIGLLGFLSSCASLVEGTDQTLSFQVSPNAAVCHVSQKGKTIGTLQNGGGQLNVSKSRKDLHVQCSANGYQKQAINLESSASGWGMAGCLIDLCITDYSTGALNKYDEAVTIALQPNQTSPTVSSVRPSARSGQQSRMGVPQAVVTRASATTGPTVQSWRTLNSGVRAYWGPNTERDFFEMPDSVPLKLLRKQPQWGLFEYVANNGKLGQVWISLNQVRTGR
jgi:hypothetical protein